MRHHLPATLSLTAILIAWVVPAAALELLAPVPQASLAKGRVVVIGRAEGERGVAEWAGGSSAFRVRDGRFHLTLNLPDGDQTVTLRVGDEALEAHWKISAGAGKDSYVYHEKVDSGECASCHDPESPPEPGVSVSELCYACHSTYQLRKFVHGPVNIGLCTACHDPHGGTQASYLRTPPGELCTYCHNQPVTEGHRKEAGDAPCTSCHDPHGTNRPYHVKGR